MSHQKFTIANKSLVAREQAKTTDTRLFIDRTHQSEIAVRLPTQQEVDDAGCDNFFFVNAYQTSRDNRFHLTRLRIDVDPMIADMIDEIDPHNQKDVAHFRELIKEEWDKNYLRKSIDMELDKPSHWRRIPDPFDPSQMVQVQTARRRFGKRDRIANDSIAGDNRKVEVVRSPQPQRGMNYINDVMENMTELPSLLDVYFTLKKGFPLEAHLRGDASTIDPIGRKPTDPTRTPDGRRIGGATPPAHLLAAREDATHPDHPNARFDRPQPPPPGAKVDAATLALINGPDIFNDAMRNQYRTAYADKMQRQFQPKDPKKLRNIIMKSDEGGYMLYTLYREPKNAQGHARVYFAMTNEADNLLLAFQLVESAHKKGYYTVELDRASSENLENSGISDNFIQNAKAAIEEYLVKSIRLWNKGRKQDQQISEPSLDPDSPHAGAYLRAKEVRARAKAQKA